MTCRRSGTGRPAVAEDGGSGDHCPNQLLQDQLFTGTGRACDREKSRKPQFREPPTPVAEEATHSLAPRERGWPLRLKGPFHSPIEVNTRSAGFSRWHMSVAVPRRHARIAREGALVDHQVPHPDHHPRPRPLAQPARFSCNIPSRSPILDPPVRPSSPRHLRGAGPLPRLAPKSGKKRTGKEAALQVGFVCHFVDFRK